jgi:hypothetical protein
MTGFFLAARVNVLGYKAGGIFKNGSRKLILAWHQGCNHFMSQVEGKRKCVLIEHRETSSPFQKLT